MLAPDRQSGANDRRRRRIRRRRCLYWPPIRYPPARLLPLAVPAATSSLEPMPCVRSIAVSSFGGQPRPARLALRLRGRSAFASPDLSCLANLPMPERLCEIALRRAVAGGLALASDFGIRHLRQRLLHSTGHSGMSPSSLSMSASFARAAATIASACSTVASTLLLGPRFRPAGKAGADAGSADASPALDRQVGVIRRGGDHRLGTDGADAARAQRRRPRAGLQSTGVRPAAHGHFGRDRACRVEKLAVVFGKPAAVDLLAACRAPP